MDDYCSYLDTPSGTLKVITNSKLVLEVGFSSKKRINSTKKPSKLHLRALKQLKEYFEGKRVVFDLPLLIEGTSFQKQVWKALEEIPYGETVTYGDIAKKIGNPKAFRAVGGACNKNKIGIVIPCHRVLGAGHKLVGYASGVKYKESLIGTEHSFLAP